MQWIECSCTDVGISQTFPFWPRNEKLQFNYLFLAWVGIKQFRSRQGKCCKNWFLLLDYSEDSYKGQKFKDVTSVISIHFEQLGPYCTVLHISKRGTLQTVTLNQVGLLPVWIILGKWQSELNIQSSIQGFLLPTIQLRWGLQTCFTACLWSLSAGPVLELAQRQWEGGVMREKTGWAEDGTDGAQHHWIQNLHVGAHHGGLEDPDSSGPHRLPQYWVALLQS